MDLELSEELIAVKELAREFAEKEIAPSAAKDDKEHAFRKDILQKMGELGFYGAVIPEKYGGNGLGFLALALITEEVAGAHGAVSYYISTQVGAALTLLEFGDEEQRRRYLPGLTAGKLISCIAVTEPDAGSDVASMTASAAPQTDGYILNGTKIWISHASVADMAVLFACTDKSKRHHGISAFCADLDQPGVSRRDLDKLGCHASPTGELCFENLHIGRKQLIGQEGEGFKICMWQLNHTRLCCAAAALGLARTARDAAVSYCNQREQFGQKIGQFQMNQDLIAQMVIHEEAARLLVYRAAWLADQKKANNLEVSVAKYTAAEAAAFAADAAVKILGAYGYSTEFPVERYLRDSKSYQIVEGSSNIQKVIIAQDALGYKRARKA